MCDESFKTLNEPRIREARFFCYTKSGGEIPRRLVDQGFSASPKGNINIAPIFYDYYNTFVCIGQ